MPILKWNFVAVTVLSNFYQSYTVEIFMNTKHNIYFLDGLPFYNNITNE